MKQILHSTRDRILAAAEQLFAESGIATTSLRTITALAKVNLAAVNYHFGSKEALIEAVFERRLAPLNKARLRRLDAVLTKDVIEVTEVVDAYVLPLLETENLPADDARVISRLLAQIQTDASDFTRRMLDQHHDNLLSGFKRALAQAVPELSEAELCWRLHFMAGALSSAIADTEFMKLVDPEQQTYTLERAVAELRPFLVAGLAAPATHQAN